MIISHMHSSLEDLMCLNVHLFVSAHTHSPNKQAFELC